MEDKFLFVGPPIILVAHELLGDALVAAKRPAEAAVAYEQELKLTPNRSGALLGLARARAARGDSTGAAETARRLLARRGCGSCGVAGRSSDRGAESSEVILSA
jgi:hypothetical protein